MSQLPDQAAGAETRAFLETDHGLFIGGEWTDGSAGQRLELINPATATPIATCAAATEADVDQAVAAARRAFDDDSWSAMAPSRRGALLSALADLVDRDAAVLTQLEVLDNGMPLNPAGMLAAPGAAKTLRYYAGLAGSARRQDIARRPPA